MKFTLTIDCDNAAFGDTDPTPELKRILKRLIVGDRDNTGFTFDTTDKRYGANEGTVRDSNGNTVGRFELTEQ